MKTVIPIFFTANDAQSPFVATALCSIKENASPDYTYQVHILFDDISEDNQNRILALAEAGFCIEFNPLAACLPLLPGVQTLPQSNPGAYATLTNNLCFFIPDLFPQYDKAVCLDIDLVVTGDISCLYREYLGTKLVGAVVDSSIQKVSPVLRYIDTYIGVDHQNYVNSGVLLLNSFAAFRRPFHGFVGKDPFGYGGPLSGLAQCALSAGNPLFGPGMERHALGLYSAHG